MTSTTKLKVSRTETTVTFEGADKFEQLLPNFRPFNKDLSDRSEDQYVWVLDKRTGRIQLGSVKNYEDDTPDLIQINLTDFNNIDTVLHFSTDWKMDELPPRDIFHFPLEPDVASADNVYEIWTDDILSNYERKGVRGGSSKVYVSNLLESPFKYILHTIKDGKGEVFTIDSEWTNEEGVTERQDLEFQKTTYAAVNSGYRAYPQDLMELYVSHAASGGTESSTAPVKDYTIDDTTAKCIDSLLSTAELPSIRTMLEDLKKSNSVVETAKAEAAKLEKERKDMEDELKKERKKLSKIAFTPPEHKVKARTEGPTTTPEGEVTYQKAHEVFKIPSKYKDMFDFDIPVWSWFNEDKEGEKVEAKHPLVGTADPSYIFRPTQLLQVLWALTTNQKAWLSGHTGTGKSTLIKEVAARMNWPLIRVNFDSEITRMDLIGRDVLSNEEGTTTSTFVDGILPQAMQGPHILLCDEIDFVRPDVAYVMQRALEDEGLLVTEDGGRLVQPDPMFRIVATANTNGQGDDFGAYQGARNQSMAFLDRFTVWVNVEYLKESEEKALLKKRVDHITDEQAETIVKYVNEHRSAFTNGTVLQPLSPRGVEALGRAVVTFSSLYSDEQKGLTTAVQTTLVNKANEQDKNVIKGLIDRVFNIKA